MTKLSRALRHEQRAGNRLRKIAAGMSLKPTPEYRAAKRWLFSWGMIVNRLMKERSA